MVSPGHRATKDLKEHTRRADVVLVAVGKPGLIRAEHVREGATVIDIGINRITLPDGTKKTVGDVAYDEVARVAGFITPVPGGVGPMTVAMLLKNTLRSAELVLGIDFDDDSVPATTHTCPSIPLKLLRQTELREVLRKTLYAQATSLADVYAAVLAKFGPEVCRPDLSCPHYTTPHAEFKHVTRLALWEGLKAGEFSRVGDGLWRLT